MTKYWRLRIEKLRVKLGFTPGIFSREDYTPCKRGSLSLLQKKAFVKSMSRFLPLKRRKGGAEHRKESVVELVVEAS